MKENLRVKGRTENGPNGSVEFISDNKPEPGKHKDHMLVGLLILE